MLSALCRPCVPVCSGISSLLLYVYMCAVIVAHRFEAHRVSCPWIYSPLERSFPPSAKLLQCSRALLHGIGFSNVSHLFPRRFAEDVFHINKVVIGHTTASHPKKSGIKKDKSRIVVEQKV
ncbi:hypothetical protein CI102_13900 [Trichoderma harzianum]|uniref:Uncharacterized protein n=1 Tax=Trichoderma harzianum CBS 226.95 TaxID=983964 RepID=A0A2T4AGU2_TRIHA|nr:hypothetical protein M431DRAFT_372492 [Trichoderma harzianum CBS 226.95]PKK41654.1 hypothetical protein CI102_13900 [Trichoderma harzianum]PTB56304.1 hypothetical protein M431DRAFT_372492 [Trichoderma harzianum CBS 226.95]